jgi:peptidyl-prolyl cis-trans isomerase A (cyclophilin A)
MTLPPRGGMLSAYSRPMRNARPGKLVLAIALPLLAAAAACQKGPSTPPGQPPAAPPPAAPSPPGAPPAATPTPPAQPEQAPALYKVKFVTTKGEAVIEVHRDWAPLGADRFYNLVKAGFYDKVKFFRAIPGFMVQFGINGGPAVSRVWKSQPINDDPVTKSNGRGFITFATAGPNTRTTQVFISLVDNQRLDSRGFSPFGQVVSGMEVIDSLYTGYGEGAPGGAGPMQARIEAEGNAYLERDFPRLDGIQTATIVP